MEQKINIAELLRDCPKGMELDCTMFDKVVLIGVDEIPIAPFPIKVRRRDGYVIALTKYGQYADADFAKCVIFPKGKTTWEGFKIPFKDGDILAYSIGSTKSTIFIYRYDNPRWNTSYFVALSGFSGSLLTDATGALHSYHPDVRFATEEEKEKLFKAIKDKGYKWNAETKTLEKLIVPKFKVGDRIRHKVTNKDDVFEISEVNDDSYGLVDFTWMIYMKYQDNYELVPNKFDITTLKPFDSKVLVRSSMDGLWKPAVFGFRNGYNDNMFYIVGGSCWKQCIPYENNEHLLGTTSDCGEYYKTW